jgi:hypothetical protein
MLLVFVVFFVIIQGNIRSAQDEKNKDTVDQIKKVVQDEFNLAEYATDGYSRVFHLPLSVNGAPYTMNFYNNEIRIAYLDVEKPFFFVPNVTNYSISPGYNRVSKINGKISVVNESAVCGDGILEIPNYYNVQEECEQDSDCVLNPRWNSISWTVCNISVCFCEHP